MKSNYLLIRPCSDLGWSLLLRFGTQGQKSAHKCGKWSGTGPLVLLVGREGVTGEELESLQEKCRMQRIKTLLNVLESKDPSFFRTEYVLLTCVSKRTVQTQDHR